MSDKVHATVDAILVNVLALSAGASTLDTIEQYGRIILLGVSICSGLILIVINWDKFKLRVKKFLKRK